MGFDFTPKNKAAGDYSLSVFAWPQMLDAGLGLVLGTAEGFTLGDFVYIVRPDDKCVRHNDGARVSASEAKELAKVARWIARAQEARIIYWESIPAAERAAMESYNKESEKNLYKLPWSRETVKMFDDFADWVEKSGGFKIT